MESSSVNQCTFFVTETEKFPCDDADVRKCVESNYGGTLFVPQTVQGTPPSSPLLSVIEPATNIHQSSNVLAQKLFNTLDDNCVYSPLSIAYIMSLLHLGAVGNTEKQITDLMVIKNSIEDLVSCSKLFNKDIIKLANAIIVNKDMPVKTEYLEMVKNLALVTNEDFSDGSAIVRKANAFIENNTNNLIKNVLEDGMIDMQTIMVLINTIYFKAKWDSPFKNTKTYKDKFNSCLDANIMTNTKYYPYFEDHSVQIVELPYKGKDFCMGFVLPKESLTIDCCSDYLGRCNLTSSRYVEVHIPKFTQRKNLDLVPVMKSMGVTDMFCLASRLDNMIQVADKYAYVSTMIHEAVVIVDEDGTEAAAVTVAVCRMESCCIQPVPVVFRANRSFVYYIKHIPTNTLLFIGDYHGN
ncbi:serine proteinase inhibitor [Tupanvirus deep ocean]|uniref:Serine proteinase inhibitor n=2 Tax=Tupanvirus TaxID=2094720 RepID=A0AC62A799_9VIRU|nr:serine proteinase inhibitor [Tupanvirus deep ocean]QKU33522.1 serine proteinase inhibitor [Tupanvirus deep ocean]